MLRRQISWMVFAALLTIANTASAIDVRLFDADRNNRFNNSSSFVGAGLDFSAMGESSNGRWGVMISASTFITANHFLVDQNQTLTFYTGNQRTDANKSVYDVGAGQRLGTSDIYIGTITKLSGADINPISFATGADAAFLGLTTYMYGIPGSSGRVGTNSIDFIDDFSNAETTIGDIRGMVMDYSSLASSSANEAVVQTGDSGAGTFLKVGNQTALVGIHALLYTNNSGGNTFFPGLAETGTIDTFLPGSLAEINRIVGNLTNGRESIRLVTVPEPSSWVLATVGVAGLGAWARRRRRAA